MAFTQDFRTQRRNYDDGETRIGEKDRLWYDSSTNSIRIGDGETPGGVIVGGGSGAGDYTLPTASATVRGGVKIGSNIAITDGVISVAAPFSGSYTDLTNKPTLVTSYTNLTDKPTIPTNTNQLTNGAGFISSYTETDPVFVAHAAYNVTNTKITNWDTAYGWGNHASAGYLTSIGTISYNDLSNKPTLFSGSYTDLTNKPSLFDGAYDSLSGKPTLFSGSYTDLSSKPTIYSSAYIGTTSLDFTRASASQTLSGVSIDGSVIWINSTPAPGDPFRTAISAASGNASISLTSGLPGLGSTVSWTFDTTKITFPDASQQTTAYTGNATTVTNGVYTTDTGTVTNTMLAGSIANNKLANSSITINGSSTALGGSVTISTITGNAGTATKLATARAINGVDFDGSAAITVTAAAGTLTGTTLNSSVVSSSLTSVGTLTGVTSNAATAFVAGDAAISGVALQLPREGALRNLYNGLNNMYFDVSIGGTTNGQFQFRSSSSFTNVLTMSPTAFNVNPDAVVTARTPSFGRLPWNSAIDTELTIDDYRFRVSNSGGIYPQIISNVSGQTKNSAWTAVAAISGQAVGQAGSTGNLVPNNAWVSLYSFAAMNAAGDTVTVTLQDKNLGRIYRVTFMRSDNGSTTGYNIIAERLL